jgi:flagellar assembly protein FliH
MKWSRSISPGVPLRGVHAASDDGGAARAAGEASVKQQTEQAAYERGLAEGEKRLSEQLLRQRGELLELQNGVLISLRQAVPQVVRQTEAALTDLALEVARKLVSGLPVSAEMVEAAVRSALSQVEETAEFDVFLHAADLDLLQQCNSPVMLPGPGNEAMHFRASPDVSRGGCLVQTRFGVVDARRETKLDLIRQTLRA